MAQNEKPTWKKKEYLDAKLTSEQGKKFFAVLQSEGKDVVDMLADLLQMDVTLSLKPDNYNSCVACYAQSESNTAGITGKILVSRSDNYAEAIALTWFKLCIFTPDEKDKLFEKSDSAWG